MRAFEEFTTTDGRQIAVFLDKIAYVTPVFKAPEHTFIGFAGGDEDYIMIKLTYDETIDIIRSRQNEP